MSRPFGCLSIVIGVFLLSSCARRHAEREPGSEDQPAALPDAAPPSPVGEQSRIGAKATARLEPTAYANRVVADQLSGEATFSQTAIGVDLQLEVRGCGAKTRYPVVIQKGTTCSDETLFGDRWDSARGEGISDVACTGTTGIGRTFYTRANDDAKPWTIGAPARSDLLGHALVVFDPATQEPIACGEITRAPDAVSAPAPGADSGPPVSTAAHAAVAGLCLTQMIVRDNEQECPNPVELAKCARQHCELDRCNEVCSEYMTCLDESDDPCSLAFACDITNECSLCQGEVTECVWGFCADQIACAPPVTPDGPCSKLEACCAMQGDDAEACLEVVRAVERLSGDPSCYGIMQDWDVNSHYQVPCKFE